MALKTTTTFAKLVAISTLELLLSANSIGAQEITKRQRSTKQIEYSLGKTESEMRREVKENLQFNIELIIP